MTLSGLSFCDARHPSAPIRGHPRHGVLRGSRFVQGQRTPIAERSPGDAREIIAHDRALETTAGASDGRTGEAGDRTDQDRSGEHQPQGGGDRRRRKHHDRWQALGQDHSDGKITKPNGDVVASLAEDGTVMFAGEVGNPGEIQIDLDGVVRLDGQDVLKTSTRMAQYGSAPRTTSSRTTGSLCSKARPPRDAASRCSWSRL